MQQLLSALGSIGTSTWEMFLLLAPLFLLGLLIAGLLHIFISARRIQKWMGAGGLKSVATSAAFGVPLPICSCGVVPVAIALRQKGASRPATLSFLITTPESGTDSILVTWALMGPIMAVMRPAISFLTAVIGGIFAIGMLRDPDTPEGEQGADDTLAHHEHHGHDHHDADEDFIGFGGLLLAARIATVREWRRFRDWRLLSTWYKPAIIERVAPAPVKPLPENVPGLSAIGRKVFRYAFIEMADDILFSLVIGILLGGILMVALPADLALYGLGGGVLPYVIMLAAGVPLYMCASASTPIAAALVAKGLSPGAALVFLLTGPATNTATIIMLTQRFGKRFVGIYLGAIVVVSIAGGILFDYLALALGFRVVPTLDATGSGLISFLEWTGALLLLALIVWRFWRGAASAGYFDMLTNLRSLAGKLSGLGDQVRMASFLSPRSRVVKIGAPLLLVLYLATGFFKVPPGAVGYGLLFGRVVWKDLPPGLHYVPPRPFGRTDIWHINFPRRIYVGVLPSAVPWAKPGQTAKPKSSTAAASQPGQWHMPGNWLAQKTAQTEYFSGDEGFVEMVFAIHYIVTDPYTYFYRIASQEHMISHYVQTVAREIIAESEHEPVMMDRRAEVETLLLDDLQGHMDHASGHHTETHGRGGEGTSLGVRIISAKIIDVHPPKEVAAAFRDLASAKKDRETYILKAARFRVETLPRARGNAAVEVKRAKARAESERAKAAGLTQGFIAQAEVVAKNRDILQDLLWFESSERALAGREKFILPSGSPLQGLTLWHERNASGRGPAKRGHQKRDEK